MPTVGLQRVDEIRDDVINRAVFSTIDAFQGYWQVNMDDAFKEKAAFIC